MVLLQSPTLRMPETNGFQNIDRENNEICSRKDAKRITIQFRMAVASIFVISDLMIFSVIF